MIRALAHRQRGFSLIELAIGLVIVATLLSALLVPLGTQMDQRRTAATQRAIEEARDALLGFAIANGRLPCPATAASNGAEKFVTGTGSAGNGDCEASAGFLPGTTLGLAPLDSSGFFVDAFGGAPNRIRYAVSEANVDKYTNSVDCSTRGTLSTTIVRPVTSSGGMRSATMQMIMQAAACDQRFLKICTTGNDCGGTGNQVLADGSALAVVWSLGPNGADTVRTPATDEAENLDNDAIFVSRVRSEAVGAEFDDMLTWISPAVLFSRMTAGGALP